MSRLAREQHSDLAGEPLVFVDEGWDNATFRLGSRLAVRLPRRESAVPLLRNEQRWLPQIATRLDVAIPEPVRLGEPSERFGWPWSIVRWVEGETLDRSPLGSDGASTFAVFLESLHTLAPDEAPVSPYRGVPLRDRAAVVEERLRSPELTDLAPIWQRALATPPPRQRRWIHGDLHPRNVIVRDGRLVGVIDWGDLTAGDIATDLACAWLLLDDPTARRELLAGPAYGPATEARAAGWALNLISALVVSGDPDHAAIGEAGLRRLRADFGLA